MLTKYTLRCKMQDNGFTQTCGRELTLAECRELFKCGETGPIDCSNCPVLEIKDRKEG